MAGTTDRPHFTRKAEPDKHIELGEFTVFQTAADRNKVVKTEKDDWSDFAMIGLDPQLADTSDGNSLIASVYRVTKVLDSRYLLHRIRPYRNHSGRTGATVTGDIAPSHK